MILTFLQFMQYSYTAIAIICRLQLKIKRAKYGSEINIHATTATETGLEPWKLSHCTTARLRSDPNLIMVRSSSLNCRSIIKQHKIWIYLHVRIKYKHIPYRLFNISYLY